MFIHITNTPGYGVLKFRHRNRSFHHLICLHRTAVVTELQK